MPQTNACDYCGADIEPGTGTMFVAVDGTVTHYCSAKCEKNADLGREPRDLEWTEAGAGSPAAETAGAEAEPEADDAESDTPDPEASAAAANAETAESETDDDEGEDKADEAADDEEVEA